MNLWGDWDVRVVETLINRLGYEPASLYRAATLGDIRWLHWGQDNDQLAALYDAISLQTRATAQQKARLAEKYRYPRPERSMSTRISSRDTAAMAALVAGL